MSIRRTGKIVATPGAQFKTKDAPRIGRELLNILDHAGKLDAPMIVTAAQNKKSALYRCFQWDDEQAAHQYRLKQARDLITHIEVEWDINGEKVFYPVAYNVTVEYITPENPIKTVQYVSVSMVENSDNFKNQVIQAELNSIRAAIQRITGVATMYKGKRVMGEIQKFSTTFEAMCVKISRPLDSPAKV